MDLRLQPDSRLVISLVTKSFTTEDTKDTELVYSWDRKTVREKSLRAPW
jgi:hypothetical protein